MSAVLELPSRESYVLALQGPLQVPVAAGLTHLVRALVRQGKRRIVLDLAHVSSIDAGGIGELIRAYRGAAASDAALRIVRAGRHVREPLERVGVFALLSDEPGEY